MASISSIKVGSTTYSVKDGASRAKIERINSTLGVSGTEDDHIISIDTEAGETLDTAPSGLRKGRDLENQPSKFTEVVLYFTHYANVGHTQGWQVAQSMNSNEMAIRYRRSAGWSDWAYLAAESPSGFVGYDSQNKTAEEKAIARSNIGLTIPSSGNATSTQVVLGSDTRLSDSRPASDVKDWAKAEAKPTYGITEITGAGTQVTYSLSGTTLTITTK